MKLIIDIPEEDYNFIKKQIADGITNPLKVCIVNGVPIEQEPKTDWIPVSEKLPERPDNYPYCGIHRTYFLVSLASGCVKALGYEFDRDDWQVTGSPVVAWMPLPESYKESEG